MPEVPISQPGQLGWIAGQFKNKYILKDWRPLVGRSRITQWGLLTLSLPLPISLSKPQPGLQLLNITDSARSRGCRGGEWEGAGPWGYHPHFDLVRDTSILTVSLLEPIATCLPILPHIAACFSTCLCLLTPALPLPKPILWKHWLQPGFRGCSQSPEEMRLLLFKVSTALLV